jgi:hypothetical protein
MANRFVLTHLRNLPLLSKLPPTQLEWVSEAVEILQLHANTLVFRQGQPAQGLYMLVSGHAILFTSGPDGEQIRGEVHENQYVGEAALFRVTHERMSMRVTQPSVILFLSRVRFQEVLLAHPEIRQFLTGEPANLNATPFVPAFSGQRQGERLLLRQQRHSWAFIRASIVPIIIGMVLVFVAFYLSATGLTLPILMLAVVIPGLWLYYLYVEWQNDYLIITDQRVMQYQRTILALTNTVQDTLISSVHEVSYDIPAADPFARLFNYGTVFIKTAGESGNLTLTLMPNPEYIQRVLISALQTFRQTAEQQDRAAIGAVIDQVLNKGAAPAPQTSTTTATQNPPRDIQPPGILSTRFVDGQNNVVYRKHISVWLGHVLLPVLFILAGGAVFIVGLLWQTPFSSIEYLIGPFISLVGIVWFYWADWDWRHDMLILGQSTIRIVHRRPLWLQDLSQQVLLQQVDDVGVTRNGLLNTLLNRGDLSVSLIGDDIPKVFNGVTAPDQVKNEIFERRAILQRQKKENELLQQRQEIARYLDVYHERVQALSTNEPNMPTHSEPPVYPPLTQRPQQPPPPQAPQPPPPAIGGPGSRPPRVPRTRNDGTPQS